MARPQTEAVYDPLNEALNDFFKIRKKIPLPTRKGDERGKRGENLRSRAREIPGYVEQIGLIPTLAFCYGKAGKELYKKIKSEWNNEEEIKEKPEKLGYAVYLHLILSKLQKFGIISSAEFDKAMEELDGKNAVLAWRLLKPYLVHLKRLIEGYYEGLEEGVV